MSHLQGFSMLLAMALRALGLNYGSNYDSDNECPPARLPLIDHHLQPPSFVIGNPHFTSDNGTWNVRILSHVIYRFFNCISMLVREDTSIAIDPNWVGSRSDQRLNLTKNKSKLDSSVLILILFFYK